MLNVTCLTAAVVLLSTKIKPEGTGFSDALLNDAQALIEQSAKSLNELTSLDATEMSEIEQVFLRSFVLELSEMSQEMPKSTRAVEPILTTEELDFMRDLF